MQVTTAATVTRNTACCAGTTTNVYSTQSGMTNYNWVLSTGGTITAGAGTNSITATWSTAGAKTINITYTNTTSNTATGSFALTVHPAPVPTISGNISTCTGVTYTYATQSGMTNYVWGVSAGGVVTAGGSSSCNVAVAGSNQCGNGPFSPNFPVTVTGMPTNAGAVSGPDEVCNSSSGNVYTVMAIENATGYNWTVPAGATITSGANSNAITVSFSATATSGNITVFGSISCGNGALSPEYPVTVFPTPETPVITVSGDILSSSAPTGNQWYYSQTQGGVGIPLPGATEPNYQATMTGWYWCVVTLNDCSFASSNQINVLMVGQQEIFTDNIQVYPVPNNGQFVLSGSFSGLQNFDVLIYNKTGQLIYEERGIHANGPIEKHFDLRPVTSGLYFMIIRNEDGVVIKKILIHS